MEEGEEEEGGRGEEGRRGGEERREGEGGSAWRECKEGQGGKEISRKTTSPQRKFSVCGFIIIQ